MKELQNKEEKLSAKEQGEYDDMRSVLEFYERGFEFMPIDLFKANARLFQIIDGKLMPSLDSIDGLGEKAAEAIVEARENGRFLSKDDFRERAKVSKTVVDLMDDLKLFGDIPQSNQMSLFDIDKDL